MYMSRKRLLPFRLLIVAGLATVFFRIVQVQVFYGDKLGRWARSQEREISLKGPRGKIKDKMGHDLAISVETVSFFVDPSEVSEVKKFSAKVAKLLQVTPSEIEAKLNLNKTRRFVWLKRQVDPKIRSNFEALGGKGIEGLGVLREYRREYPHGDLLAQILGRVSVDGEGIDGIERDYDKILQGGTSVVRVPRDARGRLFYVDKDQLLSKGESGKDVELTVDLHLQSLVESAVDEFKKKYSAESAMALVIDPLTGEILVSTQSPRVLKNKELMRNLASTDPIEPGSVIKPLIMSWGLERNFVHEKTKFEIPGGTIQVFDKTFKDPKKREHLTPEEILKYSSNVGAIKIGQRIGFKDVWTIFEKLGFLQKSGVGLSGESRGIIKKPREPQKVEQTTMFFGQGFAITPLQVARAFTVIAGDGHLRTLKISHDAPVDLQPEKVLSPKTLTRIRKLMEAALQDGGSAVNARVEGYNIAGKTGTSQKSDGKKGYSTSNYWTSFVGFLPSDDPKFLIYAAFDSPKVDVITGGKTAAPLFAEVARLCLRNEETLMPASTILEEPAEATPIVRSPASAVDAETTIPPQTDSAVLGNGVSDGAIPNLMGQHLREALEKVSAAGLEIKIRGRGHYVDHQYPPAGTFVKKNRQLVLFLK
jgi:cell division protein FtsI (penicillin-binding protein 3)